MVITLSRGNELKHSEMWPYTEYLLIYTRDDFTQQIIQLKG